LRQALSLLLQKGTQRLPVMDEGKVIGVLTLETIQKAAKMGQT